MGYMDKQSSRMQGQFYVSKSGGAGKEHGLYMGDVYLPHAHIHFSKEASKLNHLLLQQSLPKLSITPF
jgi:hypothetical protein